MINCSNFPSEIILFDFPFRATGRHEASSRRERDKERDKERERGRKKEGQEQVNFKLYT